MPICLVLGLGTQLRGLLVGGGGLALELALLSRSLLLRGSRVGSDGLCVETARLGDPSARRSAASRPSAS